MKVKSIWRISIETRPEAEEAVAELMGRVFGRPAAIYADEETKSTLVSVYCERRSEWTAGRRSALQAGMALIRAAGLEAGTGRISARRMAKEDWAESWKRHFKAIEIGTRLLVKPGWIKLRPKKGQAVVILDPGLSFGTGNHPTTAFCLRALAEARVDGTRQSFWDVGTGSGILAIAAAKLGFAPVEAIDFDAEAVRVARENARRNQVRIQLRRADITRLPKKLRTRYDLICANLMADLLVQEARRLAGRLADGGALVVAGILQAEFSKVQRACKRAGLKLRLSKEEGEWRSGVFGQRG